MTVLRKVALKISDAVVRYASPGCKDWAEGLAREAAFIKGDWSAFAWAIGSTRVLLDRRGAPVGSLADVPAAAIKFVEITRSGLGMWLPIVQGPFYAWNFFFARSWHERVGCVLVVFGSILAGTFLLIERRRLKEPIMDDVYDNIGACALFYKAELERRAKTFWIPCFVLVCYGIGVMLGERGEGLAHTVFCVSIGLLCLVVIPVFLAARGTNLLRLQRLNQLLDGDSAR